MNNQEILNKIKEAAETYYKGESIITDSEYDKLVEQAEELGLLTQDTKIAEGANVKGNIHHKVPMLSLAKAKNMDELKKYHKFLIETGAKGFILQFKFDGLAVSAVYKDGKLTEMSTRGDGTYGENISYLINSEIKLDLPLRVQVPGEYEIRGELFLTEPAFQKVNENKEKLGEKLFSNSRNAIAGLVKKAEKKIGFNVFPSFMIYSSFHNGKPVQEENLNDPNLAVLKDSEPMTATEFTQYWAKTNFNQYEFLQCGTKYEDLENSIKIFKEFREQSTNIPTDGVVIKPINEVEMLEKLGSTSHHPLAFIAYKYPGETAEAEVLEIILQVGRTGRVTPVAKITPTTLSGTTISRITLHNFSFIYEKNITVGSKVEITRANDVIPAILRVTEQSGNSLIEIPPVCPICGEPLFISDDLKTIQCMNENCKSRKLAYLEQIVGRPCLDIEGLSSATLETLFQKGIVDGITTLLSLEENVLENLKVGESEVTFGKPRAKKVKAQLNRAIESTPSWKILASLNIKNLGGSTAKTLIKHFGGIVQALSANYFELKNVPGIGEVNAKEFSKEFPKAINIVNELVDLVGLKINDPKKIEVKGSFSISGSIPGFPNRDTAVEYLTKLGWEFHSSPKATTTVLFADPNSTSSKVQKAKKMGVRIIQSIEELENIEELEK